LRRAAWVLALAAAALPARAGVSEVTSAGFLVSLREEVPASPQQARAVNAVLTFKLEPAGDKTAIVATYRVRGSPDAALDKMAGPVDAVIGEQVKRLADLLRN